MRMRILVTGAGGFVGGALARRLHDDGHDVVAVVRREEHLEALRTEEITVAFGDIRDPVFLSECIADCTHVAHLAAQKTARSATLDEYRESNVAGTRLLLDAAEHAGVSRFVYASTLGIHGFVNGEILTESSPVRPNTMYRRTKWEGEQVVRSSTSSVEKVIARLSSAVGAGAMNWLRLVRRMQDGSFRLIGDGSNHMDLVAIEDMVDALTRCITVPGVNGRTYVIGCDTPTTVAGFTGCIARELGVETPAPGPSRLPYVLMMRTTNSMPLPSALAYWLHDREQLVADKRTSSARAREELGYVPAIPIGQAVHAMITDNRRA